MVAGVLLGTLAAPSSGADGGAPGTTRIAQWKGDRQAAFLLMFDDSAPSHVKNVIPQLTQRGLTGTFYVNPGKGEWKAFKDKWEKEFPKLGIEYANHTSTHKGAKDVADAEQEILDCNRAILAAVPGKEPRLISFGVPGVKPGAWNVTDQQLSELLARHNLVLRPPFGGHGGAIHVKTADEMMRLVDKAIAAGSVEYIIYHGVGGDWISVQLAEFTAFLDKLAAKQDQVWVTGHIAAHKYQTQRGTAAVKVVESGAQKIRLDLSCAADPKLYDEPLTLVTRLPAGWAQCQVAQGSAKPVTVEVKAGQAMYDAVPGAGEIALTAAK